MVSEKADSAWGERILIAQGVMARRRDLAAKLSLALNRRRVGANRRRLAKH